MPIDYRLCTVMLVLVGWISGCRPASPYPNGVHGYFGGTGLGYGDFSYPRAITVSDQNKIFVADKSGRIQRFSENGTFEKGWWMPNWKAGKPVGLTVHPDGRLLVADTHYNRVLIFDQDGHELGSFGEYGDGPGQFYLVTDVAVDDRGYIYVSEYGGNDRISKWSPDLEFVKFIGAHPVAGLRLSRPAAMAVGHERLWVADACNHRVVCFSLDGEVLDTFGTVGDALGQLRWPYDINVYGDGSIMVCEYGNHRLQWFTTEGKPLRTWGEGGRELGQLYSPWGAIQASNGLCYVLDSLNNRVQIVRAG